MPRIESPSGSILSMPDRPDLDGAHLEHLSVTVGRLHLSNLPVINQISVSGDQATFREEGATIETSAPYRVEVEINEADLCAFVRTQLPDRLRLRDLRITEAGIEFSADAVVIVPIPVRILLRLAILNETEIHVVADNVNVLGAGPKQVISNQLQLLNPLLRARDLPVAVRFTGVSHQATKLTVVGTLEQTISLNGFVI